MTWAAVAIGGSAVLSTGLGLAFGGGSSDVKQVPLETPEQAAARQGLLGFAQNGTYGNYTAGTPYTGSLGDFGIGQLEQTGLNTVASGANAPPGALFSSGSGVLQDLLNTDKYNPLNQTGMIQGLTGAIDYNTKQASDAAKRSAGYTGSLYSTDAVRNLGNVQAQGNNTKATTLANLYQNYINSKFAAAPQAINAQQVQDQEKQQQLSNEFTYGALPRTLNTAADQAQYQEFQRQRNEKQGQITALSSVAGSNSNFGVPNVSIPQANPWADIAGLLAQFGGQYLGSKAGQPKVGASTTATG